MSRFFRVIFYRNRVPRFPAWLIEMKAAMFIRYLSPPERKVTDGRDNRIVI